VFSDASLGLRYAPPSGLTDETSDAQESVRERAAALHTTNTFDVLLRMTSGPDDTAPDWHSVGIQTYARSKFAALDDTAALNKINVWTAGAGATAVGTPEAVSIAGHRFVVSTFERSEPPLLKHARTYSLIRNGKLVSFAFSANSSDKLGALGESLQTLEFTEDKPASYLGLDRNDYPGDDSLAKLHRTFAFTGFWLNAPPGAKSSTWVGTRGKIEAAGFGFLVLFNGRLDRELSVNAAGLGASDAQAAMASARREGFPARTIIFLDQEEGGRMLPEQKQYLFAWVDQVTRGGFRAGVYCSGIAFREKGGTSVVTAEDIQRDAGGRDITFWVTNDACPPSPGCVTHSGLRPRDSGSDFAEVWQFAQSPRRNEVAGRCGGYDADGGCYSVGAASRKLIVDLNVATLADPSQGRNNH